MTEPQSRRVEDLAPRLLSAASLIPLALGATAAGGPWLAAATASAVVALAWEWASMSEPHAPMPAFWMTLGGALGAVMLASLGLVLWGLAWAGLAGGASAIRRLNSAGVRGALEALGGVFYLTAPCVAFLWIRAYPAIGLAAAISLFAIIWAADGAAYFSGRLVGGPKLLPSLSANKTVAGLLGGLAAGALAGLAYGELIGAQGLAWSLSGLALAGVGMAGDLFESMLKRRFGVKDASQLIPGHGGVMDRIDGLMAASVFMAAALILFPEPVRRLFGGVE
ncbi:MAG TPA: phosphatidate cytidylyltransferase [Caulobacterales bacterium]|nr:phosphatidate cytidylyltransferase [Caulobacterales bacterium]